MRITLVSPKADLIAAIAGELQAEDKDYSRTWVVFPEKRPAYYLRKKLAAAARSSFIPPRIDSLDGFIAEVDAGRLGFHDRPIDVLDAVALLFDIHRGAPGALGGPHFLTADQFFPLGAKLFRDLEELKAGAVGAEDLRRLDSWEGARIPAATARRLQSLSFFFERFYEALAARGLSTPASRAGRVLAKIDHGLFPDIDAFVFAGFLALTKTERDLLKRILSWDKSRLYLVKGRGGGGLLASWDLADPSLLGEIEDLEPLPELVFTKSADTHGQLFALNKALKGGLDDPRLLNESQVIVLPAADTLFPLYQQTLSRLSEEDFNISLGYPLSRTPLYAFFDKLFELLQTTDEEGRLYARHYLQFVLHPYTKNIYFPGPEKRADLTRILFHAIEEVLTERRTKSFWSMKEIEDDAGIRDRVQDLVRNVDAAPVIEAFVEHLRSIHARTFRLFARIENVGDFADKLIRVLTYVYEASTARLHYFFHPFADAFLASLEALSRSLLRDTAFDDPASYFNLFRKVISAGTVPFFGTPLRGLQILGFWETRGIPFKDVSILDMSEGVLPAGNRGDSLLPTGARLGLGLPTHRDTEAAMEYALDTLIRGADRVHLFFVENEGRERSRFAERLIWERQKRDREPRGETYVQTVRYKVALQAVEPRPVEKTGPVLDFLRHLTYSATSLDLYLRCPLRFYHAYVLNLKEPEEIGETMERKDIGTVVHSILEDYFKKFVGRTLAESDVRSEDLAGSVGRTFDAFYGGETSGPAYLLKLQIERHLEDFLLKYQIPLIRALASEKKSLRILFLEGRISAERTVGGTALKLMAKVDRIETRGGDICILDYKTSGSTKYQEIKFAKLNVEARETWAPSVSSLQLPLYRWIFARKAGRSEGEIHPLVLLLGKAVLGPAIEFSPYARKAGEEDVRKGQIERMDAFLDRLLAEIIDPEKPFHPCPKTAGMCRDCPFANICNRR